MTDFDVGFIGFGELDLMGYFGDAVPADAAQIAARLVANLK